MSYEKTNLVQNSLYLVSNLNSFVEFLALFEFAFSNRIVGN